MLRPSELLDTARTLVAARGGSPTDADLRRSISTAYYAVFHSVLTAGADRFVGAGVNGSAGYGIVYRAFDHGRMRRSCEEIGRPLLSPAQQKQFGRTAFHFDLRAFAQFFVRLQSARISADYDPRADFTVIEAREAIDDAERAIASLGSAPDDERSDLLALMLASSRG